MTIATHKTNTPMRYRSSLPIALAVAFAVFFTGILSTASAQAAPQVETMVLKLGNKIIKILKSGASRSTQEKQFKASFIRQADMATISRFTLGKYARTIKGSDRKKFQRLLSQFITKIFIGRMRGTNAKSIRISSTNERKKGRDYIVKSLIDLNSGAPIRVNWRVFKKSGRYRIFDISIEGLWLAQEQRSTFVSILSNNNGKIGPLLTHLKQQISKS